MTNDENNDDNDDDDEVEENYKLDSTGPIRSLTWSSSFDNNQQEYLFAVNTLSKIFTQQVTFLLSTNPPPDIIQIDYFKPIKVFSPGTVEY